jgi:hypothetical protein
VLTQNYQPDRSWSLGCFRLLISKHIQFGSPPFVSTQDLQVLCLVFDSIQNSAGERKPEEWLSRKQESSQPYDMSSTLALLPPPEISSWPPTMAFTRNIKHRATVRRSMSLDTKFGAVCCTRLSSIRGQSQISWMEDYFRSSAFLVFLHRRFHRRKPSLLWRRWDMTV